MTASDGFVGGEMLPVVLFLACALAALPARGAAAEPKTELLWPGGAPGAKGDRDADKPALTVHLAAPEKANGTAVVICPGGGYGALMMSYEGHDIAKWLNSYGVAGVVLKYRISPYRHPAPMLDAQRAMRMVRARAKDLGLEPARIGLMGFSAGGHLASTVGTHFDEGDPKAADPVDRAGREDREHRAERRGPNRKPRRCPSRKARRGPGPAGRRPPRRSSWSWCRTPSGSAAGRRS